MALLKYTTSIAAEKTVAQIQSLLAKAGAKRVMQEFDEDGRVKAVSFMLELEGQPLAFTLPTDWRPVLQILNNDPKVPNAYKNNDQAVRVAWRITLAWVEAQLAIIETKMVKTEQVFLPYMVTNNGKTVYEQLRDNPGRLLGGGDNV